MKYKTYSCKNETITIPQTENYRDCLKLVQSDIYRHTGKIYSFWKIVFSRHRTFRFLFWLRMSSHKGIFHLFCRFQLVHLSQKTGLHISWKTPIGYGLYLGHGLGIIINPTAIIGNNCNLSQFTTIGSNKNKAATIGNNVYIGPSVCIVENIQIGSGSTIGAGSVVTKDVPSNTTVAGTPAKIIHNHGHAEFINWKWDYHKK